MKYVVIYAVLIALGGVGCSGKKTAQNQPSDTTRARAAVQLSVPDSIEQALGRYDRQLDIKMRRKVYEPQPGKLVTLQKWLEQGDSTRMVKLREEIITGTTRMEVIQYHFLGQQLAEVHDYLYDKNCNGSQRQCMQEAKYFFRKGAFYSAVQRSAVGTTDSVPVVERVAFMPFTPDKSVLKQQQEHMARINRKYASLPEQKLGR